MQSSATWLFKRFGWQRNQIYVSGEIHITYSGCGYFTNIQKMIEELKLLVTSLTWKYVPLSGKLPLIAVLHGIYVKVANN